MHICVSIPPKYAVSSVIGYIMGRKRNFTGESLWARGFYISTVGLDEDSVRKYIPDQEAEDARLDQLNMFDEDPPPSGGS
jgi:putative transposase